MVPHKILPISNFESQVFNVSYDEAEQIYRNSPRIKLLIKRLETASSGKAHEDAFLDICRQLGKRSPDSPYAFRTHERPNLGKPDAQELGICLLDKTSGAEYKNMHVVGQLNHESTPTRQGRRGGDNSVPKRKHFEITRCIYSAFCEQDFRLHLFAFSLHQTKMRTFAFARYGACSSDEFDVVMNPLRLVRALTSFLRMNKEELGYDPTHTVHPDGTRTLSMTHTDQVYQLDSCLYSSNSCASQAISIWKATAESGESVIVKDCWQRERQREEGGLLRQEATSEALLFPEWYGPKDGHHIRDWPAPQQRATYIYHETVKNKNSIPFGGRDKVSGIAHPRRSRRKREPARAHPTREGPDDESLGRELRRVVVKYLKCRNIESLGSPFDLFTAIRDCVDGHWALYRAGVLHRNVCKDNLMVVMNDIEPAAAEEQRPSIDGAPVAPKKKAGFHFGLFVDLNFAAEEGLSTQAGAREPFATGNKQFMAKEVLEWLSDCQSSYHEYENALRRGNSKKAQEKLRDYEEHLSRFKQEYRHDLESFYWVLLWCLFQMSDTSEVKMMNTFDTWKDPRTTFDTVFNAKNAYFTKRYKERNYFTGLVDLDSATAEVTFGSLLVSLTDVLSDTSLPALPAEELYCRFQGALAKIIEFLRVN